MQLPDFLILALAIFYWAFAVSSTHGPWHAFERLRQRLPLGGLTACIVCLSPWLGGLFWLMLLTPAAPLVWISAGAGVSVFIYRYTGGSHV